MSRIRKMKGFTLIELIVVVVILGILAAIAAVSYNQFVGTSKKTAAYADAQQLATAINAQVANDTNGSATPQSVVAAAVTGTGASASLDLTKFNASGVPAGAVSVDSTTDIITITLGSHVATVTPGTDTAVAAQVS